MDLYFNIDDLSYRLGKTACWIAEEAQDLVKHLKYSGTIKPCRMTNLSYVVASLEALECYTPVVSESQNGQINCLSEAEAEILFNNISKISGIAFPPKGITFDGGLVDSNNQFQPITLNDLTELTLNTGGPVFLNKLTKEF